MYITDVWGVVYKIDVRSGKTGKIVWKMDPGQQKPDRNRGVALWGNLVISVTGYDGRIIATDAETGQIVWDKKLGDQPDLEFTAAPLALKDTILIGASGGDNGVRNWLAGLDPKTGEHASGRPSSSRRPASPAARPGRTRANAWQTGGGALYVTGSYDPATNLTYWGTGNPAPRYDSAYRPGDNLFTNSLRRLRCRDRQDAVVLPAHRERQPRLRFGRPADHHRRQGQRRGSQAPRSTPTATASTTRSTAATASSSRPCNIPQKVTWTKGIDPKTGKPVDYDPNKDVQNFALRLEGRRRGDEERLPRRARRHQFLAAVLQPEDQAPLHHRQRRLRQHRARPDRARARQVRRRRLRQRGAHHLGPGRGRSRPRAR